MRNRVLSAHPYRIAALGSFSTVSLMLIRQYQFPDVYDQNKDQLIRRDHDRCQQSDYAHVERCFRDYSVNDINMETWFRASDDETILKFIQDMLMADAAVQWTGFRVLGTASASGRTIFSLQLFAKNPNSNTKVYSGDKAPNVLPN